MRKVLILFALLCSLTVYAQDVITKKDGNTIVCRVMEVNQTEVVYKKWSNLQGDNYVMNIADIASINYENGERKTFGDVSQGSASQIINSPISQNLSDADLLNMVQYSSTSKKIRITKNIAWIGGSVLMLGGGIALLVAIDNGDSDYVKLACIPVAVGAAWTTVGLIMANRMKNKYATMVESAPLMQHDFKLNNKSSLSAQLCSIKENINHTSTIGVGVKYNF